MKKQYIKPQSKVIVIRPMGLLEGSPLSIDTTKNRRTNVLGSREVSFFDDDEDEEEESIW